MEEWFEEIPGNDGMEINFFDLMCEDGIIVFPWLFDTDEEILDSISVFESIESGSIDEFIIECLGGHIILDLILFFDDVGFGETIGELLSFVDFVEIVVIETVDVKGLGLLRLLVFDCLF